MNWRHRLAFWLLALDMKKERKESKVPKSKRSEVRLCHNLSYESMVESIVSRSKRAQLIFLHMFLRNLKEDMLFHVERYTFYITRKRETGYVDADTTEGSKSDPNGRKASRSWEQNSLDPEVLPTLGCVRKRPFSEGDDFQFEG